MPALQVNEWTAQELARRIESGEPVHVLDVRAPFRLESGRIDVVPDERFHNVRGSELLELERPASAGLPVTAPIAVVCGRGTSSRKVAQHLAALGLQCASLQGGMAAWMALALPRELEPPPGWDRLVQFDRVGKGALSYVLVSRGEALVVDAPRHTKPLLDAIADAGARVTHVADTHVHADFISGSPALARELRVPYHLHPADAVYPYDGTPGVIPFEPLRDGAEIAVGNGKVQVVHTPGHTEGSVSYRLGDHSVLTGDFLFVESIGRPDLAGKADEWARKLWGSVERTRAEWPAGIRIRPGHYASASERNRDLSVGRTLGEIQAANEPLGIGSEKAFLEWVLDKAGSFPEEYRRIKAVNVGLEHPSDEEMDELEAGRNQCAV